MADSVAEVYLPDGFDAGDAGAGREALLQDVDEKNFLAAEVFDEDASFDLTYAVFNGAPTPRGLDGKPEGSDPEAPFGRFANGKPRKRPKRGADTQPGLRAPSAPSARRGPGRPRAVKPSYADKVQGLLQLPAAALALAGTAKDSDALVADAATLSEYAGPLSQALGDLAESKPEFAAVLDKVLSVGPYGALLAVAVPMVLQVLANHKLMPPVEALGVRSREDVLGAVKQAAP